MKNEDAKPSAVSGSEDKEPPQSCAEEQADGERLYFKSGTFLNAMFSGNLPGNLKLAGERLGVQLLSRDCWVRVLADDPERKERAISCLKELELAAERSDSKFVDSGSFMQILNVCASGEKEILAQCYAERIKVSPRRKEVIPGTRHQLEYVRAVKKHDVVFGVGPAGTGKTYLAMAMAVSSLLSGESKRIILTRPAVEAGENLGFLPGNLQDKINPYLRPLYDALYSMLDPAEAVSFTEHGVIEVAPLAFMRGRTLSNAFVILDEAQNATGEQMLMFLTRLGPGSKCVICGDPAQSDLPRHRESGLRQALQRLHGLEEIGICEFDPSDVLRHTLVEKIIRAYEIYGNSSAGEPEEFSGKDESKNEK